MTAEHSRYIAKETAIGVVISVALSVLFFLAFFRGRSSLEWWGADRLALDFLPQTFMIALMGALVPGLLTRQRLRNGGLSASGSFESIPVSGVVVRAVVIAAGTTALLGGAAIALVTMGEWAPIKWEHALMLKMIYGGLVAAIATPLALSRLLRSTQAAAAGATA